MILTKETARTTTSVHLGRLEMEKVLSWLALALPLAVSATLNLWNLAQNGYSNLYYSVAVQSMTQNFRSFFYGAYDPGGFIMVDKPPVSLWIQTISAKIFGFSPLSILLPEALAGIASVAIVYFLVRRIFGTMAGFVAALALALTPIAVAVERTNNTDSWLMLFLLLAAWAISLATEKSSLRYLALSMALVGVAFNVKMLAAFVVLPAFYLLYFLASAAKWPVRVLHLALASVVLFGVALSWPLAVDLTPADQRPWVGGSQVNSVLDLALGYNGLGRVNGNEGTGRGGIAGGRVGPGVPGNLPNFGPGNGGNGNPNPFGFGNGGRGNGGQFPRGGQGNPQPFGNGGGQQRGGFAGGGGPAGANMFGAGQPGATRLFTGLMAEQWSWLFPLAAFGVLVAALSLRLRWPLERRGQALLLWGGWLVTYGAVFSVASGIFHPYYLIMLAPAAAALVGIGVSSLWAAYRRQQGWLAWLLPVALLATAYWQTRVVADYPQWSAWLTPLLLTGSIAAAGGLIVTRLLAKRMDYWIWRRWTLVPLGVGLLALLLSPAAWAVTPVLAGPSNASLPTSGPEALNQNDPASWTRLSSSEDNGLIKYLENNQAGYYYLVAVANSQQASSIALKTEQPVLAAGGFMGSDPALTPQKLQEMVAAKQVRFVMGLNGATGNWVQSHCKAVDSGLYQGSGGFSGAFSLNGARLYNCAP